MADRKKVINGLQELHGSQETMELISDALALLKDQEMATVEKYETEIFMLYSCSSCGTMIGPDDKYCRICGKRLKWE